MTPATPVEQPTEALVPIREAARILGVHVNTMKRMAVRGDVPYFRVGARGDRRFRPSDLLAYASRRAERNGSTPE